VTNPPAPSSATSSPLTLEEAFITYDSLLRSIARRFVNDPDSAQDLVQEAWLRTVAHAPRSSEILNWKAWLSRIIFNIAANNHRRKKTTVSMDDINDDGEPIIALSDMQPSPLDLLLDKENQQMIESALWRVSPPNRTCLVLREIEGLSHAENAEVLEISVESAKKRAQRARMEFQSDRLLRAHVIGVTRFRPRGTSGLEKVYTQPTADPIPCDTARQHPDRAARLRSRRSSPRRTPRN
jgi:RNA polymerase sigma-70 factor (ECF subfamily)